MLTLGFGWHTAGQVRFPAITARLEEQGFVVAYSPWMSDVVGGLRPAIYDTIIFAKRD